ncbi:MAG TPA: hypothetical protein VLH58_03645 [Candidatus Methylomirabilis sp.]|nr:hypothetical protein [Candidatus Methylomirabilis sp.]
MGMEHVVHFLNEGAPDLRRVMELLAEHGFPVQMRMADGELTMPNEVPPEGWKDVRLGTPSGMVTLARRDRELLVVTWGNADDPMQRAWNAVAWAVAKGGSGQILRPGGLQDPDEFRRSALMPDALR